MNANDNAQQSGSFGLLIAILIAIIAGVAVGGLAPEFGHKLDFLGEIFLNALKMIVVPLVMFSMLVGITSLGDVRKIGGIGGRTIVFYMVTTGLSVLVGLILVNIFRPGVGMTPGEMHATAEYRIEGSYTVRLIGSHQWERENLNEYVKKYTVALLDDEGEPSYVGEIAKIDSTTATVKSWSKVGDDGSYIATMDGKNLHYQSEDGTLVEVMPEFSSGKGVAIALPIAAKVVDKQDRDIVSTLKDVVLGMIPVNIFKAMVEMDVLPLIVFSLLLGAVLTILGDVGKIVIQFAHGMNEAIMKMVHWLMYFAPIGIMGLLAGRIGKEGGFVQFLPELKMVGMYFITVLIGLIIHGFITLPLILMAFGRRNPWKYFLGMAKALMNAFSTASSSATLPLTMEGVEEENKISTRTSSFVLPLGATINMDGTALYEAVAAVFIAQMYAAADPSIDLGLANQVVIALTATLAAIGAAGIPEAGLVTMVIVLKAAGLPIEGITLILTVDWLLDRFRTTVNVWGDSVGAGVIETLENGAGSSDEEAAAPA
ncbi:MAG: dicarboxylate/amino acid:cation symporter [Candidatus Poribacteria bacterium]|nr:dicarboxylate/amino acid:cation symporter [Candidatus Poribacteria bacterium]